MIPAEVIVNKRPAMTGSEARQTVERIRSHIEDARSLILDLYERRGWKSLGYANWSECGTAEFGVTSQKLNRLLTAARLEREVVPEGQRLGLISEKTLAKLHELPPGKRKTVYEAGVASSGGKTPTTARIAEIVARAKAGINPALLAQDVRSEERTNIDLGRAAEDRAQMDNRGHRIDRALWHLKRSRSFMLGLGFESEEAVEAIRKAASAIKALQDVG